MKLERIDTPQGWEDLPYHELCLMFPEATETEFDQIVASMENNGFFISDPIVLVESDDAQLAILDGRTRHQAALEARVKPEFLLFSDDDALGFVCSRNLDRRMLSAGQKAALGSAVATLKGGQTPAGDSDDITVEQAARMTGASTASIKRFRTIQRRDEALAEAVKRGDRTLNEAWERVKGRGEGNGQQPSEAKDMEPSNSGDAGEHPVPADAVESGTEDTGMASVPESGEPAGSLAPVQAEVDDRVAEALEEGVDNVGDLMERVFMPPITKVTLDRGPFKSSVEEGSPIIVQVGKTMFRLDRRTAAHLGGLLTEYAER